MGTNHLYQTRTPKTTDSPQIQAKSPVRRPQPEPEKRPLSKPAFRGLSHELMTDDPSSGLPLQAKMTIRPPGDQEKTIPTPLKEIMENQLKADFTNVSISLDNAPARLGAKAFTQGDTIHINPNDYHPETVKGRELLGHELTHIVQQRQGRVAGTIFGGIKINADPDLEAEAETKGKKAANATSIKAQGAVNRAEKREKKSLAKQTDPRQFYVSEQDQQAISKNIQNIKRLAEGWKQMKRDTGASASGKINGVVGSLVAMDNTIRNANLLYCQALIAEASMDVGKAIATDYGIAYEKLQTKTMAKLQEMENELKILGAEKIDQERNNATTPQEQKYGKGAHRAFGEQNLKKSLYRAYAEDLVLELAEMYRLINLSYAHAIFYQEAWKHDNIVWTKEMLKQKSKKE